MQPEHFDGFALLPGKRFDEVFRKKGNIVEPFAQRRQRDGKDVQPVKEISSSDRPYLAGCPGYQYQSVIFHAPYFLALVGGEEPQELVTFSAGIGGTAIAQALGPLKRAVAPSNVEQTLKLEVRAEASGGGIVLQQR